MKLMILDMTMPDYITVQYWKGVNLYFFTSFSLPESLSQQLPEQQGDVVSFEFVPRSSPASLPAKPPKGLAH